MERCRWTSERIKSRGVLESARLFPASRKSLPVGRLFLSMAQIMRDLVIASAASAESRGRKRPLKTLRLCRQQKIQSRTGPDAVWGMLDQITGCALFKEIRKTNARFWGIAITANIYGGPGSGNSEGSPRPKEIDRRPRRMGPVAAGSSNSYTQALNIPEYAATIRSKGLLVLHAITPDTVTRKAASLNRRGPGALGNPWRSEDPAFDASESCSNSPCGI
jgi:hypothetical protein